MRYALSVLGVRNLRTPGKGHPPGQGTPCAYKKYAIYVYELRLMRRRLSIRRIQGNILKGILREWTKLRHCRYSCDPCIGDKPRFQLVIDHIGTRYARIGSRPEHSVYG